MSAPKRLHILLIKLILLFISPLCVLGADSTLSIVKISASSDEQQSRFQIHFSQPYQEAVSSHFDDGVVRLTLPNSGYDEAVSFNYVNDRFVRYLRLFGEGKNTTVEILFADQDFQAVGRVKTEQKSDVLNIYIDKKGQYSEAEFEESPLSLPVEPKVGEGSLPFNSELMESGNITANIIKMLIALSMILLLFYSLLWAYNRFFVSRFSFKKGNHSVKLVSSYHISPKQKIVIIDVNHRSFACGVTVNNISLISEVTDTSFQDFLATVQLEGDQEVNFSKLRTQYIESKVVRENHNAEEPKRSFSNELINRVRKLKPID